MFAFVNSIPNIISVFHFGSLDHTKNDTGGYMYFINVGEQYSELFRMNINGLCTGICYEFSAYLVNVVTKSSKAPKPNIRFEVRSTKNDTHKIAQNNTDEIPDFDELTWSKHTLLFNSTSDSVTLLMITEIGGKNGNDAAIDDIELRVCANQPIASCLQCKQI